MDEYARVLDFAAQLREAAGQTRDPEAEANAYMHVSKGQAVSV